MLILYRQRLACRSSAFLGVFLLGNVVSHTHDSFRFTITTHKGNLRIKNPTFLAQKTLIELELIQYGDTRLDDFSIHCLDTMGLLVVADLGKFLPDNLFFGLEVEGPAILLIDHYEAVSAVANKDATWQNLDDGFQEVALLVKLQFRLFALADIAGDPEGPTNITVKIVERQFGSEHPFLASIALQVAFFPKAPAIV